MKRIKEESSSVAVSKIRPTQSHCSNVSKDHLYGRKNIENWLDASESGKKYDFTGSKVEIKSKKKSGKILKKSTQAEDASGKLDDVKPSESQEQIYTIEEGDEFQEKSQLDLTADQDPNLHINYISSDLDLEAQAKRNED